MQIEDSAIALSFEEQLAKELDDYGTVGVLPAPQTVRCSLHATAAVLNWEDHERVVLSDVASYTIERCVNKAMQFEVFVEGLKLIQAQPRQITDDSVQHRAGQQVAYRVCAVDTHGTLIVCVDCN